MLSRGAALLDAAGQHAAEEVVVFQDGGDHARTARPDRPSAAARGFSTRSNSGARSLRGPSSVGRPSPGGRGVEHREVELLVGGAQRGEQVEHLVMHFVGARRRAVDLVDTTIGFRPRASALPTTNLVCGSTPFGGVDQHDGAVHHVQDALDLAAEIGVAGVSTMLMRVSFQTTEVHLARMVMPRSRSRSLRIHGALGHLLVSRNVPDCLSSWSTSVVLPWSTWAMMAILRMSPGNLSSALRLHVLDALKRKISRA
jgi:hypothetical protein